MSKIQTIKLQNFKSISEMEADFKGCSAIITGGNNKGKTSFLKGVVDRIRFIRPDVMLKNGESEGRGELTLDTGEKFVWEFDATKDKLTYLTTEGRKSVTKELGARFFPPVFDIDKFLQSPPKSQVIQLQQIIGLDFTDIDARYKAAYDFRTEKNREAELYRVKLEKLIKCDKVEPVDLTDLQIRKEQEKKRLNELYLDAKRKNQDARRNWELQKIAIDKECAIHNEEQGKRKLVFDECFKASIVLKSAGFNGDTETFLNELRGLINPEMVASELYPKEPTYIEEMPDRTELDKIDAQILAASEINAKAAKYNEYIEHVRATASARDAAKQADDAVKAIEQDRLKMIESAKMPAGISFTSDGITVDGFPLDRNQISTSKLYTSALKIASINLGEVRTLYFDASFLDRHTLADIQAWANENDLQLLIERPDFDGGEIKYELLEQ
jgi:hypothetical protein